MRVSVMLPLLLAAGAAGVGCAANSPQALVQSALADTHLGWQPAPENQLVFALATASGIGRVMLHPLPQSFDRLTLELPGMREVREVHWRGDNGEEVLLYDGVEGAEGVSLEPRGHGRRLQIGGTALNRIRTGGLLTVIDRRSVR